MIDLARVWRYIIHIAHPFIKIGIPKSSDIPRNERIQGIVMVQIIPYELV